MSWRGDIWKIIRHELRVTAPKLVERTGAPIDCVRPYLHALTRAGVLERQRQGVGHRRPSVYVLVNDIGPRAPTVNARTNQASVKPGPRYRAWQSIRSLRLFDVNELMATADVRVQVAQTLVQDLRAVGYVALATPANGNLKRRARYRLVKNTGPLPLVHHKRDGYYADPNTQEEFRP